MKCEQKFLRCEVCGNLVGLLIDGGVPMECCGQEMVEIVPNTVDAKYEAHVPAISVDGDTVVVNVGSIDHPMLAEHYIQWVYIKTKNGGQRKCLLPGEKPVAKFQLVDDELLGAFGYCNLHGLWYADA
ncbi:MAG: desulfoferrodoxin family protein [Christensenellales bacterium]|jgi:superoxide reductase